MPLSGLIGQPRAAETLGAALRVGRLHHALLVSGPEGAGKTALAEQLARCLNCESPAAAEAHALGRFVDDPCGTCRACRTISADPRQHSHPLVLWVDTEAQLEKLGLYRPSGDRTAAQAIGVRLLRDLVLPRVQLGCVGGRRKVCIFRDVRFGDDAQDAFLKTLEEPPPSTTFVILSSTPEVLKQTIRSRCIKIPLSPLSAERIVERLRDAGVPSDEIALRAALSGGSVGAALQLTQEVISTRRTRIEQLEQAGSDVLALLRLAEQWGQKEGIDDTLDTVESWLQDLLRVAAGAETPSMHIDLAALARTTAQRLGSEGIQRRQRHLPVARRGLEQHVNARLVLERLFLAWCGIQPLTSAGAR